MKKIAKKTKNEDNNKELLLSQLRNLTFNARLNKYSVWNIILQKNTTTFVWTVRNPILRAVSVFDMDHIQTQSIVGNDFTYLSGLKNIYNYLASRH